MPTNEISKKGTGNRFGIRNLENLPGLEMGGMVLYYNESDDTVKTDFKPGSVVYVVPLAPCVVQSDGSLKNASNVTQSGRMLVIGTVLQQNIASGSMPPLGGD